MSIGVKEKLTQDQNIALNDFATYISARFKYRGSVKFSTVNNHLRFTDRMFGGFGSFPGMSAVSSDKEMQRIVASIMINLQINNNKVSANASMKLAYLACMYSSSSVLYQETIADIFAQIEADARFSTAWKDQLKISTDLTFKAVFKATFEHQVNQTMKWAKTKLGMSAEASLDLLASFSAEIDSTAYTALRNTVTECDTDSLGSIKTIAKNEVEGRLGSINVIEGTSTSMTTAATNVDFAPWFDGFDEKAVDRNFGVAASNLTYDSSVSSYFDDDLDAMVVDGTFPSYEDATVFKNTLMMDVMREQLGAKAAEFDCEAV